VTLAICSAGALARPVKEGGGPPGGAKYRQARGLPP
jgi:hypothetical protein